MSGHQNLDGYNGTLYGGMEYSSQVPDHLVIGSPGGVSSTHHHYTGGFYGKGGSSSDNYAGQGYRYPHAEYGNVYETGHSSSQQQGYYTKSPDKQYWQNNTQHSAWSDDTPSQESFELIEPADTDEPGETQTDDQAVKWVIVFFLALLAFMVFDFTSKSCTSLIRKEMFGGKEMEWHQSAVFAVIIAVIFALFSWLLGSAIIKS